MAQSAPRWRSRRTGTVATLSCQRTPAGRGPGAGLSASTAVPGSRCQRPFREDLSAIGMTSALEKLAETTSQLVLVLGRPRRLGHLGPLGRRPDLDALHGAGPGDFFAQPGDFAQTGRNEDAAQLVDGALLRRRDERARQVADVPVEHRALRDILPPFLTTTRRDPYLPAVQLIVPHY